MTKCLHQEADAKTGMVISVYDEIEISGQRVPNAIVFSRPANGDPLVDAANPWASLLREKDWRLGGMLKFAMRRLWDACSGGEV